MNGKMLLNNFFFLYGKMSRIGLDCNIKFRPRAKHWDRVHHNNTSLTEVVQEMVSGSSDRNVDLQSQEQANVNIQDQSASNNNSAIGSHNVGQVNINIDLLENAGSNVPLLNFDNPEQKEVGNIPEQKEVGNTPEQKEVGNIPEQKEVGNIPEQKEMENIPEQKEVENIPEQKEEQEQSVSLCAYKGHCNWFNWKSCITGLIIGILLGCFIGIAPGETKFSTPGENKINATEKGCRSPVKCTIESNTTLTCDPLNKHQFTKFFAFEQNDPLHDEVISEMMYEYMECPTAVIAKINENWSEYNCQSNMTQTKSIIVNSIHGKKIPRDYEEDVSCLCTVAK